MSRDRQCYIAFDDALLTAVRKCGDDPLLQRSAWQAIKAYGGRYPRILPQLLTDAEVQKSPIGKELTPRIVEWLLTQPKSEAAVLAVVLRTLIESGQNGPAASVLSQLALFK